MSLKLSDLPDIVVLQYNTEAKATRDGYVNTDIQQGMYGILKAGLTAQQLLEKFLNKQGYLHIEITSGFGRTIEARYVSHYASIILA